MVGNALAERVETAESPPAGRHLHQGIAEMEQLAVHAESHEVRPGADGQVLRELERVLIHRSGGAQDRKSTRLNSSHLVISYAVFCLKKKKKKIEPSV